MLKQSFDAYSGLRKLRILPFLQNVSFTAVNLFLDASCNITSLILFCSNLSQCFTQIVWDSCLGDATRYFCLSNRAQHQSSLQIPQTDICYGLLGRTTGSKLLGVLLWSKGNCVTLLYRHKVCRRRRLDWFNLACQMVFYTWEPCAKLPLVNILKMVGTFKIYLAGDWTNHLYTNVYHGLTSTNQIYSRRALPPAAPSQFREERKCPVSAITSSSINEIYSPDLTYM